MDGRAWLALLLMAPTLSGCMADEPTPTQSTQVEWVLEGRIVDAETESGLSGVRLHLDGPVLSQRAVTAADGGFRFVYTAQGPCTLYIDSDEFSSGELELDCSTSRHLVIRLEPIVYEDPRDVRPPEVEETELLPGPPEAILYHLNGTVSFEGQPVARATVTVTGDLEAELLTNDAGEFALIAASGAYEVAVDAPCLQPIASQIDLTNHTELELIFTEGNPAPPEAPGNVQTHAGPGPAQTTITWDPPANHGGSPVERYQIYRDGRLFTTVGNNLAYGDTGASPGGHSYAVAAVNGCKAASEPSPPVEGTPLPGTLVTASVSFESIAHQVSSFDVLDASGNVIGQRQWRLTNEVGNCCETYVASDSRGRLYEYGGTYLRYTEDHGQTWFEVSNVLPALGAEGAIVGAPGGDMLAINWDPYTGDMLWSHKYVAATDTWYTARTPLHQPFFDRPWVAVIEGPFQVAGQVVPYVSFLMSNYVHGDILLASLDGLHYQPPSNRYFTQLGGTVAFPSELPPDPDRDWIQSMRETDVFPIDDGFGLRSRSALSYCDMAALADNLNWGCPNWGRVTQPPAGNEVIRVDSWGNLHIFDAPYGETQAKYRASHDGGRSWTMLRTTIPDGLVIEEWDVQVNGALNQAVMVVHASETTAASTRDADFVIRYTNITTKPEVLEILRVGKGDHAFGGGLTSEYDRFDYTTVAILANGGVALSFGDSQYSPPGVAIEIVA